MCGKEFGIAQSTDGKTFYYGKACSLGLKSVGRNPYLKLNELIISKISKTVQIALGHEGLHALFLNEDGNVYFAGEFSSNEVNLKQSLIKVSFRLCKTRRRW